MDYEHDVAADLAQYVIWTAEAEGEQLVHPNDAIEKSIIKMAEVTVKLANDLRNAKVARITQVADFHKDVFEAIQVGATVTQVGATVTPPTDVSPPHITPDPPTVSL